MLNRRLGSSYTDIYIDNGKTFLPDLIIYNMDENEYRNFWQSIKNQRKGRLCTDGIDVYPISWAGALFQSFKGWLGFENYCDPNKVEMTLAKIAYHGYLKGFDSQPFQDHPTTTLSSNFKELIKTKRDNATSAALQQQLMSYYVTYSAHFPNSGDYPEGYPFGSIFVQENLSQFIPSIDAQDPRVVGQSIRSLFDNNIHLTPQDSFPLSTFSETYADFLVKQNKLTEALKWSQKVKMTYKVKYIDFFITNRCYDSNAAPQAFELIAALFTEDPIKAVHYTKTYFSDQDRLVYLKNYPDLKRGVAKSYLQDAIKEKAKYFSRWRSNLLPLLSHAVNLDPNILDKDTSMQDVILLEDWITYQFNDAIQRKRFPEARDLYEKHPKFKFDKNNLTLLRNNYAEEVITKKNILDKALEKLEVDLAEATADERIKLAEQINKLAPEDKTLTTVTIDYAATLVRIDEIKHPKATDANLEQLQKAQNLIEPLLHLDGKNAYLKKILNQILLRKIECFREKVQVPSIFNSDQETRTEFVEQHKNELKELQINLKKFISVNEKNKENAFRPILAKMHYLLGDVISFFFRNNTLATPHFKKASEVMSENLYYNYRYCQLAKKESLAELEDQFKAIHDMHMTRYITYMEQRWDDDQDATPGIDIHGVPAEDRGLMATLTKAVLG